MPKDVMAMVKEKAEKLIVAGGFIRACVSGEDVSDIDLFVPTVEDAKAWAYELKGRGEGRRVVETQNAISVYGLKLPVQFVHRWTYDAPAKVVESFDFTIARAAMWWKRVPREGAPNAGHWESLLDDRFYPDVAAKRLVYSHPVRNEDAGGSLLRVLKFYQRGYRIPLGDFAAVIARLAVAVDVGKVKSQCTTGTKEELEDQWAFVLTGLLREVDPSVDPDHASHLPANPGDPDAE